MKKNLLAFSLIELIVATTIATIGVFWIYSLIWNNQFNINNLWEYSKKESLYYSVFECIKTKGVIFSKNKGDKLFINFWNNLKQCNITNSKKETKIDGIEYIFKVEIFEKYTNFLKLKISIEWWNLKKENKIFNLKK
jgi:hypothetical protein